MYYEENRQDPKTGLFSKNIEKTWFFSPYDWGVKCYCPIEGLPAILLKPGRPKMPDFCGAPVPPPWSLRPQPSPGQPTSRFHETYSPQKAAKAEGWPEHDGGQTPHRCRAWVNVIQDGICILDCMVASFVSIL